MPFVVGVTGGIASGKTTVTDLFHQQFAIDIVDADIVAREVVAPGTPGLAAIKEHFGAEVLSADGTLNRRHLRELIFSCPEQKQWLDSLLHPMIRREMQARLAAVSSPYTLLVVPLLVENQLQSMTDRILVIDVSPQTQISRTMRRDNVSQTQAEAILAAQASRKERLALADDVILNDDSNQDLLSEVTRLHQHYLQLCSDKAS